MFPWESRRTRRSGRDRRRPDLAALECLEGRELLAYSALGASLPAARDLRLRLAGRLVGRAADGHRQRRQHRRRHDPRTARPRPGPADHARLRRGIPPVSSADAPASVVGRLRLEEPPVQGRRRGRHDRRPGARPEQLRCSSPRRSPCRTGPPGSPPTAARSTSPSRPTRPTPSTRPTPATPSASPSPWTSRRRSPSCGPSASTCPRSCSRATRSSPTSGSPTSAPATPGRRASCRSRWWPRRRGRSPRAARSSRSSTSSTRPACALNIPGLSGIATSSRLLGDANQTPPKNVVTVAFPDVTLPTSPRTYYLGVVIDPFNRIKQLSRVAGQPDVQQLRAAPHRSARRSGTCPRRTSWSTAARRSCPTFPFAFNNRTVGGPIGSTLLDVTGSADHPDRHPAFPAAAPKPRLTSLDRPTDCANPAAGVAPATPAASPRGPAESSARAEHIFRGVRQRILAVENLGLGRRRPARPGRRSRQTPLRTLL